MKGEALLAIDESSSRHRSVFIARALGKKNKNGFYPSIPLGIRQLSGKDAKTIYNEIDSIIYEIIDLSQRIESLSDISMDIIMASLFFGLASDHISTNKSIYQMMKSKQSEKPFEWVRCIMHKWDLMESHLIAEFKKERKSEPLKCGNPPSIDSATDVDVLLFKPGGMKTSNTTRPNAATDFLYRASLILSSTTKGEKANWGAEFKIEMQEKGIRFAFKPIDGSRLHIYSHAALRTYGILPHLLTFIEHQYDSWTKRYLLEAIENPVTLSELRILGLFGYAIAEPFTAHHNLLTVGEAADLTQKTVTFLKLLIDNPHDSLDFFWTTWEKFPSIENQPEKRRRNITRFHMKCKEQLQPILHDWCDTDNPRWKNAIEATLRELQKIGEEYLNRRTFGLLSDFVAHNLDVERTFAILKNIDTRKDHRSITNLEATLLYRENILNSKEGTEIYKQLTYPDFLNFRKRVRELPPPSQVENRIENELRATKRQKIDEETRKPKEKQIKAQEEALELAKIPLYTDPHIVTVLRTKELKEQLKKHRQLFPHISIPLTGDKEALRTRLLSLLSRTAGSPQPEQK